MILIKDLVAKLNVNYNMPVLFPSWYIILSFFLFLIVCRTTQVFPTDGAYVGRFRSSHKTILDQAANALLE